MAQGFGPALSVSLTEEKKKELDEAADKFKKTVGSTKPVKK